jgi:hypothetical protein
MPTQRKPASRATKPQQRHAKPKATAAAPAPAPAPAPEDDALFDAPDAAGPAPAPAAPVEPVASTDAPAASNAELVASDASHEEAVEPPVETPADPPVVDPVVEPAEDDGADDDESSDTSVASNEVRLGHVSGVLHRVPIEIVQDIVASSAERIVSLRGSKAVLALQERVLSTEGRCAPVVLTHDKDSEDPPMLFSGLETVAAAMNVELSHLVVVVIDAADAGAAQSYLAQAPHRADTTTEDDLVRQVLSYQYE